MGLDMYLDREIYIGNEFKKPEEQVDIKVFGVNKAKVVSITERVGSWRKANAIHAWFVTNVQDGYDKCQRRYYVEVEKLKELLGLVESVLADHSLAEEKLPTQSGFFFGCVDYDEHYFKNLEDTKNILNDAIADRIGNHTESFYYYASW